MKEMKWLIFLLLIVLTACRETYEHKTVICIPVYGQSLALGEDAQRITDFDSLANYAGGRIVTENMDHRFGYFDLNTTKQFAKKMVRYQKRSFELSVYSMAEWLADHTGEDTIICIFPGGQDGTIIANLGKGSAPYLKFIRDIETAYKSAQSKGWDFVVPAICWMQGETDVTSYPGTNYRQLLLQFTKDIENDVKLITGQKQNIEFICYQANPVTRAKNFNPLAYICPETEVPQTQLELVRDHPQFHASGPTYPYNFVNEIIHIDGLSQKKHGLLAAQAAMDILKHQKKSRGLLPIRAKYYDMEVVIDFSIPCPPLTLDTIRVTNPGNYGFNVITPDNRDITRKVFIQNDLVHILCNEFPKGCRVRYAVNGDKMKVVTSMVLVGICETRKVILSR
ncbi:MAG: hypothetical protein J5682_03705 [Prevotella sp.]|nr:hypothetical protein [Prevotella sp.]